MMTVDELKCIGCGKCVKDCFPNDIEIVDGKAVMKNTRCIKCGHCIAVCPTNAIAMDDYDMSSVKSYSKEEFDIEEDHLLNFIKFRRTVRQFTNQEVTDEQIIKIIEAGRYTQTGSNQQDVSYVVVRQGLSELKELTFQALKETGEKILADPKSQSPLFQYYANFWINMADDYRLDQTKDKLFFNAPLVIVIIANSDVNGSLAASNMELMTNALGLGTFFSGFMTRASLGNEKISEFLSLKEGKKVVTCMVIGHPAVKYLRTVPRKEAEISWK